MHHIKCYIHVSLENFGFVLKGIGRNALFIRACKS